MLLFHDTVVLRKLCVRMLAVASHAHRASVDDNTVKVAAIRRNSDSHDQVYQCYHSYALLVGHT